eukprot:c26123_g2_i1 orf=75-575(+)
MEGGGGERMVKLKSAFSIAVHSLLTACSYEDFVGQFPSLEPKQHESLYKFYAQVMAAIHENVEDEFHEICEESKVMETLDRLEHCNKSQRLTIGYPQFLGEGGVPSAAVREKVLDSKLNELNHLKCFLKQAEEQNHMLATQLEALHKEVANADDSSMDGALKKVNL